MAERDDHPQDEPGARLARFAATLDLSKIPAPVLRRAEDLFLDWFACVLAGRSGEPVQALERYVGRHARDGDAELLTSRRRVDPLFAAMLNSGASHMVEQDDVHNGSVFHAAAVVFGPALAVAQARNASGAQLLEAIVAGYEVGIRLGEYLGRPHYKRFHTTATAGCVAAAAATGRLLGLDAERMLWAFGSAATQAGGLWEYLREGAQSKQLHCAHAAIAGITAAELAADGYTGARRGLEGAGGMGAAMSENADPAKLVDGLGTRWTLAESSFKFHASCRHTHPAADALLRLMRREGLKHDDLADVLCGVHQGAIDVLGPIVEPASVHQSKFSMGTVLGLIAVHGRAQLPDFDADFRDPRVVAVRQKVRMQLDPETDSAYPARWIGKVRVTTTDGRRFEARVDEPKGDPGNTLSRAEIEDKARRLAAYANGASGQEMETVIARAWNLEHETGVRDWLR
ncbi:MmgE/PrpD family protein [Sinimarinibacterium flocculans]|uniref:MmgE/PrpD family protein n=1 Tax=Sinimarinibacterium flocculans TaxID=985250 RepID=UPI003518F34C